MDHEHSAHRALERISAENVKFLDLRFSDPRGKLQHVSVDAAMVDEDMFVDGVAFDGSSIKGWKAIDESDMMLMLDPASVHYDPFYAQSTLGVFCDVLEPSTGQPYGRDPRTTAKNAEAYLKQTGIGDTAFVGPEAEFFIFDDVRFTADPYNTGFSVDSTELPVNGGTAYEAGNLGHRPRMKGGYFPVNPIDSCQDIRSEMLSVMAEMGVETEKHHHEVGAAQHELGVKFSTLTRMADKMQLYKYVVHNVAHSYGKSATFMPKPVLGDNGSGMHCHFSLWKNGKPNFAGNRYADLSEECLWFIGGIIRHARALNAFTNPTTNSYKRLVPGYEAPVLLAYSSRNRSAACRIPHGISANAKRLEIRFPDPSANPYLAFAGLLMAGLDGITNKIHPGDPMDKDLYDLPPEELKNIAHVSASLSEALDNLEADHAFLTRANVFGEDQINTYIALKREEDERCKITPHPAEYDMYYSV
ncbi:MAG: type I glutamate--ammonia ligase [Hyphomicrobiales bacterium]